jgi:hypothetical protein
MQIRQPSLIFSVVALVVMTLNSFAHAEEDKKIGVAVSAVINGSPGTGPEVSEALGAALATTLKATVVAGAEAQALLPESARTETCLGDSACLVEAGKALGVDELLMLIIVDSVEEVKVEATWVNVNSGKTALRPSISASKAGDSMAEQFAASASSLLPDIEVRVQVAEDTSEPLEDVGTPPPDTSTTTGGAVTSQSSGRQMSSLSKQLFIGGAVALGASLGYGAFRRSECGSFSECDPADDRPGLDAAADVVGVAGVLSLSVATYLFFSSSSSEGPAPVSVNVSGEAVGFSMGGRF